jgi:hypothetical protein
MGKRFMVCAGALLSATGVTAGAEVIPRDGRVQLASMGACTPSGARTITYEGRQVTIVGSQLRRADGSVAYATLRPILDALGTPAIDAVLTDSSLILHARKTTKVLPLLQRATAGRLLVVRPDRVIYYLTTKAGTGFYTHSPARQRLFYATGTDFVAAHADRYGNVLVATTRLIVSINRRDQVMGVFSVAAPGTISGFEVMADNGLLVTTGGGLVKISSATKVYSVIAGPGSLRHDQGRYVWCDSAAGQQYLVSGLDAIGLFESDRQYGKALVADIDKLVGLGAYDKALDRVAKLLELMPQDPRIRALAHTILSQAERSGLIKVSKTPN